MQRGLVTVAALGAIAGLAGLAHGEPPRRHGRAPSGNRSERAPQPPAPDGDEQGAAPLPEQPSKADILSAIDRVRPRVDACYEELQVRGVVRVRMTVVSSGRVTSATATGALAGTPSAACVEEAAKTAQFRPFRRDKLWVTSTFLLRPQNGDEPAPADDAEDPAQ